jgi:hypothetical protein
MGLVGVSKKGTEARRGTWKIIQRGIDMGRVARPRPKMSVPGFAALLVAAALSGYWGWTYTGLYKWLADWQLEHGGQYEVELTWVFTFLILAVPFYLVTEVVRRVAARTRGAGAPDAQSPEGAAAQGKGISLNHGWLTGATIAVVGLGFVVAGGYQYHQATGAGAIAHVDAADYESARPPTAAYISVTGFSVREAARGIKSTDSDSKYFIPLVSAGWDLPRPVGLFLETDTPNMMESNAIQRKMPGGDKLPEVWEGMIDSDGLPGMVRSQFEKDQVPIASGYCVLSVGKTPAKQMSDSKTMMMIGGCVAGAGVVIGVVVGMKQRRVKGSPGGAVAAVDPRLMPKGPIDFTGGGQPPENRTGV